MNFPNWRIGLTGGIGCGKSTALAEFHRLGWSVLEADKIARQILTEDPNVRETLLEKFGKRVLNTEGVVDRKALGEVVFSNKNALLFLESLLHPKVREVWKKTVSQSPSEMWIVEIPLLFEKNLEKDFHYSVCLGCSSSIQIRRLLARGMTEKDIRTRISHQMPLAQKMSRANYVITNDGSFTFLHSQIQQLHFNFSSQRDPFAVKDLHFTN